MTKRDFIFSLLRSALWQQPLDHFVMNPWEYKEVMTEAEKQCVLGLVIDCLRSNNMTLQKKCVIHMLKLQNSLEKENKNINDNLSELVKLLSSKGIRFAVVKGPSIGTLYPKPLLRIPGDIDFYVPAQAFQEAVDAINQHWEMALDGGSSGMHIAFEKNDVNFEMHRYLLSFPNKKTKQKFDALIDQYPYEFVEVQGVSVPTLMPTVNVFYIFLHLYNHFIKLGVALRQLCDLAVLLHRQRETIDRTMLKQLLEDYGFTRAFAAIGYILTEKLGLPVEDFPMEINKKDKKNGENALDLMWKHGNWGMYERDIAEKGSFKYFIDKTRVRLSSQLLFYKLSPKYNRSLLLYDMPERMKKAIKALGKKK